MQYLILILILGFLIWVLFILFQLASGKRSLSYLLDARNRYLQKRLLQLLYGDVPTAKRLLQQKRNSDPGRSNNWYLEKVIHDLERDRKKY